jgi:hypothetical protein
VLEWVLQLQRTGFDALQARTSRLRLHRCPLFCRLALTIWGDIAVTAASRVERHPPSCWVGVRALLTAAWVRHRASQTHTNKSSAKNSTKKTLSRPMGLSLRQLGHWRGTILFALFLRGTLLWLLQTRSTSTAERWWFVTRVAPPLLCVSSPP